jgi:hypothetical protein
VAVICGRYACRGLGAGRNGFLSDTTVREGTLAVEEARARLRRQLEETYGIEGAAILMDRPPGGWSDLVTNQTLDLKLDALEHRLRAEFRGQITRLVRWIVPTIFAGIAAFGAAAGVVGGVLAR